MLDLDVPIKGNHLGTCLVLSTYHTTTQLVGMETNINTIFFWGGREKDFTTVVESYIISIELKDITMYCKSVDQKAQ